MVGAGECWGTRGARSGMSAFAAIVAAMPSHTVCAVEQSKEILTLGGRDGSPGQRALLCTHPVPLEFAVENFWSLMLLDEGGEAGAELRCPLVGPKRELLLACVFNRSGWLFSKAIRLASEAWRRNASRNSFCTSPIPLLGEPIGHQRCVLFSFLWNIPGSISGQHAGAEVAGGGEGWVLFAQGSSASSLSCRG